MMVKNLCFLHRMFYCACPLIYLMVITCINTTICKGVGLQYSYQGTVHPVCDRKHSPTEYTRSLQGMMKQE